MELAMFDDATLTVWERRVWEKVEPEPRTTACWLWSGARSDEGYGIMYQGLSGKTLYAHRVAYEIKRGPIPQDKQIDHLCRTRHCVNPDHMELVSRRENILRGISFSAQNAKLAFCPAGHPYSGSNLYLYHGWRRCRTCTVARTKAWRAHVKTA